ncbi:coagulation factor V-like [Megalobrama amblycephala]|uniref:coagulation factor V-like n=1 Tax=Megalobrama amblycephala TaxID=75352 RepID=UPI002013D146|nr:coagulation factor V-like [Megalobrama amblycephala]
MEYRKYLTTGAAVPARTARRWKRSAACSGSPRRKKVCVSAVTLSDPARISCGPALDSLNPDPALVSCGPALISHGPDPDPALVSCGPDPDPALVSCGPALNSHGPDPDPALVSCGPALNSHGPDPDPALVSCGPALNTHGPDPDPALDRHDPALVSCDPALNSHGSDPTRVPCDPALVSPDTDSALISTISVCEEPPLSFIPPVHQTSTNTSCAYGQVRQTATVEDTRKQHELLLLALKLKHGLTDEALEDTLKVVNVISQRHAVSFASLLMT